LITSLIVIALAVVAIVDRPESNLDRAEPFTARSPEMPGYLPPNSLSLSPGRITLDIPEQGRSLPEISLTNTTDRRLQVSLGFFPYRRTTTDGTPIFSTSERALKAGKDLVRLSSYQFEIAPRQVRTISAEVVGQPRGQGPEAFGVISAAVALPSSKTQLPSTLDGRSGTAILQPILRLSAATWIRYRQAGSPRFSISSPVIDQSSGSLLPQVAISAQGQSSIQPFGDFILYRQGRLLSTVPFANNALVPPGDQVRVIGQQAFAGLSPGRYTLQARAFSGSLSRESSAGFRVGKKGTINGRQEILPDFSAGLKLKLPVLQTGIPMPVVIKATNTGGRRFWPRVRVELLDRLSGAILDRQTLRSPREFEPGGAVTINGSLRPLLPGNYLLSATALAPDGLPLGVIERQFSIGGDLEPGPGRSGLVEETSWLDNPFLMLALGMFLAALLTVITLFGSRIVSRLRELLTNDSK
jgi:hypothetical protein